MTVGTLTMPAVPRFTLQEGEEGEQLDWNLSLTTNVAMTATTASRSENTFSAAARQLPPPCSSPSLSLSIAVWAITPPPSFPVALLRLKV
eukprot:CAMPEP_0114118400 /NCGR_PEP_ID=MMETSP0043_2-20121206/5561_1 /TAXON_ID=464988 /ORGANISM="Hemiselmis andersenii, Strain CCMP644" /LENGTH=89 /DNA_ID=CAMNT_0001210885 /DNA_START=918 /DNA_END=1187 /DNA_ORIENTATION=+